MERKEVTIGYHMTINTLKISGWEAAVEALKEAGSRAEALGIFRALRENANGRSLAL